MHKVLSCNLGEEILFLTTFVQQRIQDVIILFIILKLFIIRLSLQDKLVTY